MALKDSRFLPALRARSIPVADRGDLAVRPTRPGRCRVLPATFAIAALPARTVRVHGYPPNTPAALAMR
jgi:hypothetical protein